MNCVVLLSNSQLFEVLTAQSYLKWSHVEAGAGWGRVIWGHNSGTIIRWDYSFWETLENPFTHSLPPSTCKQRRRNGATQKGAIPSPGQRPSLQHELTTLLHGGPVSKDPGKNSFFCWSQPPPYGTFVMLTQTKEHRTLIKPTYVLKQH